MRQRAEIGGVRLISAHPSCPGKYEILLTGNLSDVQTALERVRSFYGSYIVDAVLMGRIDESVVKALMGAQTAVATGALGIVETFSAASAIKAADTAVKTSKVEILDLRVSRGMGGKGVVMLTGEVSDVTAAVEAGGDYAKQQGAVLQQLGHGRAPRGAVAVSVKPYRRDAAHGT